jgi:hypothetical protein
VFKRASLEDSTCGMFKALSTEEERPYVVKPSSSATTSN